MGRESLEEKKDLRRIWCKTRKKWEKNESGPRQFSEEKEGNAESPSFSGFTLYLGPVALVPLDRGNKRTSLIFQKTGDANPQKDFGRKWIERRDLQRKVILKKTLPPFCRICGQEGPSTLKVAPPKWTQFAILSITPGGGATVFDSTVYPLVSPYSRVVDVNKTC